MIMNKGNRLYRSSKDRMIAGVAAGLAEYFDIDPVITRVAFVVLTLSGGFGILTYIILWIVLPYDYEIGIKTDFWQQENNKREDNHTQYRSDSDGYENITPIENENSQKNNAANIAGVILIIIGAFVLFDNIFDETFSEYIGPTILILAGLGILYFSKKKDRVQI